MNVLSTLVLSTTLLFSLSALAAGGPRTGEKKKLEPAKIYSGSTPIDPSHGVPFNNGTFGAQNPNYESWAQAQAAVPGVSEKTYPFSDKNRFITGLRESADFVRAAVFNWEQTSPETKEEAKAYSQQAVSTLKPILAKFDDAIKAAASAGSGDWESAQGNARKLLAELRGTYSQLHRNIVTR